MRIAINGANHTVLGTPVAGIVEHARQVEADGFASYWLNQTPSVDALTVLALVGQATDSIELGTAVVPTWTRHPAMLAGQALTVQSAAGDRLALGIGLNHRPAVEEQLHVPFDRPVRHLREYLDVLLPLLADREVDVVGEIWSATASLTLPPAEPPEVLVAAMGPQVLSITGQRTAGTVTWMAGPRTVDTHLRPALEAARAEAGLDGPPRIVASLPVAVTDREAEVRDFIGAVLSRYGELPSYRAMLDVEGVDGPADVSVVGTEDEVRAHLQRFADAGATDFAAVELGLDDDEVARTRALLKDLAPTLG